jgi:4-hydroxybenzoate polyprenyltransferase
MIKDLLRSMRPEQWYKNVVIFAGLVFSINLFNFGMFLKTSLAFVIFCMLSGSVYLINDLIDAEKDRKHPKKKKRPIASGKLGKGEASVSALLIVLFSIVSAYFLINADFFLISLAYFFLMFAYSERLKDIAFVDIIVVGVGFIVRAYAGTVAIDVPISPWLILSIFVLALFLAITKRMAEFNSLKDKASLSREVFEVYNKQTLEFLTSTISSLVIICYSLYAVFNHQLIFMSTIPFVIYGIFRAYYVSTSKKIENAELFFKDKAFLLNLVAWLVVTVLVIY